MIGFGTKFEEIESSNRRKHPYMIKKGVGFWQQYTDEYKLLKIRFEVLP